MTEWKRYGDDDVLERFADLPAGGIMLVDQRGMRAICSRNRSTSRYREAEGQPGMFEVMKVAEVERKQASLEDRIMKIMRSRGSITMGVLVNLLRNFSSEDVQKEVRRMIAMGKLSGFKRTHKYNKTSVQYISITGDDADR